MKKKIGFMMVLTAFFAAGVLFMACEQPTVEPPESDRPGGGGGGRWYDNPGSTTPAQITKTVASIADVSGQLSAIAPGSTTTFLVPVTGNTGTQTFSTATNSNLEGSTIIIQGSGTPAAPLMAAKPFSPLSALTRNGEEEEEDAPAVKTGVIQFTGTGAMFTVVGNITLIFKNIVLEGIESNTSALVVAQQSSCVKLGAGSAITGNTNTSGKGGGVFVDGGNFVMEGGSVKGNKVSSSGGAGYGGGVYVESGLFTLTSGTISKNTVSGNSDANGFGGGVYVSEKGFFDKTGGAVNGTGADENTATGGGSAIAIKELGKDEIESINETVTAAKKTGNVGATIATQLEAITTNGEANKTYSVIVTKDETLEPQTLSGMTNNNLYGATIIISSNIRGTPRRVTLSGTGALFNISSIKLVLQDIVLVGVNNNTSALVVIGDHGTLEMLSGSKITGNTNNAAEEAGNGGGVYVNVNGGNNSGFSMSGNAEISGNTAKSNGGGVYVSSNTSNAFSMTNTAVIKGNTAGSNGGGVYIAEGTFSMANAAEISGNKATGNGGGIYAASSFEMSGTAVINGNSAGSNGGGIYAAGSFEMSGTAVINGNKATGNGGGVYATDISSGFSMKDTAVIKGNSAGSDGGGVCAAGRFSMTNTAEISGNTAKSNGGGVYAADYLFSMTDTTVIKGNSAGSDGGGVYATGGFSMSGTAVIRENNAGSDGGGVCAAGYSFGMAGTAEISGNTAKSNGGGVYAADSLFSMTDTTVISKNTAESNGGGVYAIGNFEMKGGAVISGNTAKAGSGGGVYNNSGGTSGGFSMLGTAVIRENNAGSDGGGVYANTSGGTIGGFSIADTAVISGNTAKGNGGGVYNNNSSTNSSFSKTGGTIYGSNGGNLKNTAGNGQAVYCKYKFGDEPELTCYRNTTAGTDVELGVNPSTLTGDWEQ